MYTSQGRRSGGPSRVLRHQLLALSLLLGLLLVVPASAFIPAIFGHSTITFFALGDISREVEGQTVRFSARAIDQVIAANRDTDCGGDAKCRCKACQKESWRHFDNEDFLTSTFRLVNLKELIIINITKESPDGAAARQVLGEALHTVQDYYSHSNWVNLGFETFDGRLGSRSFNHTDSDPPLLASPSTNTCPDNPDQLGGDGLDLITTGFFDPNDSCKAPRDPIRKCRHGGVPLLCPDGLSKDHPLRPMWLEAQDAARLGSVDYVNKILDDVRVRDNPRAIKALMDVGSTLAVAVDTRTIPQDMDNLKFHLNSAVNDVRGTQNEPVQYVLVAFNNLAVQPPVVTANADVFLNAVNGLQAEGNPTNTLQMNALLKAIAASQSGSPVFLFERGESFAADTVVKQGVISQARAKGIHVFPFLSVAGFAQPHPDLENVAKATQGQFATFSDSGTGGGPGLVFPLVRAWLRKEMTQLQTASGGGNGELVVPFQAGMEAATFSVMCDTAANCGPVALLRPSGAAVNSFDPGITMTVLGSGFRGLIVGIQSPESGSWRLQVGGASGQYSAQAVGDSELRLNDFAFVTLTGRPGHEGLFPIQGQPAGSGPHKALASLLGPVDTAAFRLVDLEGNALQTVDLTQGNPDAAADEWVGTFEPPAQPFQAVVSGLTTAGSLYERTYPGVFQVQPVEVTHTIDFDTVSRGDRYPIRLHFTVRNLGPAAATFEVRGAATQGTVTFGCGRSKASSTVATLDAGASTVVKADLTVPSGTALDSELMVSLTATSTNDATVTNGAVVTFTVKRGCESYTECTDNDGDGVPETCVLIIPSCAPPPQCQP